MKSGYITKTNQKGQIVIPKKIRDQLGIDEDTPLNVIKRGKGVHLYPIADVVTESESEDSYLEVLKKTKGTWSGNWEETRKKRKEVELDASKQRKNSW